MNYLHLGTYARLPNFTDKQIQLDNELWNKLPEHNRFIASRLKTFSNQAYQANNKLMQDFHLSSWSDGKWLKQLEFQENGLFSSVFMTYEYFNNLPHMGGEANAYTVIYLT